MGGPMISFLSDFGPDAPAAICRGVMLSIAPDARILDISHAIRKYAIRDGAFVLWTTLPWLPVGVHVAVVDPGVGTDRRPIGLRVGRGDVLVGPDNGLLIPASDRLGGLAEARELANRDLMLPRTTSTFHGRDIFAPVAAHLAAGRPFESVGPVLPVDQLVPLHFPPPVVRAGTLEAEALYVDSFGNIRFGAEPADLAGAIPGLAPGTRLRVDFPATDTSPAVAETATWARTFGALPLDAPLLYEDSSGQVALADNQGNAAARLGIEPGRTARISRS